MSWSYSYKGDVKAMQDDANAKFSAMSHITLEPERQVMYAVHSIIVNCVQGWKDDVGIDINAYGSQSTMDGKQTNSVGLTIRPVSP